MASVHQQRALSPVFERSPKSSEELGESLDDVIALRSGRRHVDDVASNELDATALLKNAGFGHGDILVGVELAKRQFDMRSAIGTVRNGGHVIMLRSSATPRQRSGLQRAVRPRASPSFLAVLAS